MDLSAPINDSALIRLYSKFILLQNIIDAVNKVPLPINHVENVPLPNSCSLPTLALMAEFILDLLAGDVKSFLVSGGDFCYFAGDLWLAERIWISHALSIEGLMKRDDSYLSVCPSAENMTLNCHYQRPREGLVAYCRHAITLMAML